MTISLIETPLPNAMSIEYHFYVCSTCNEAGDANLKDPRDENYWDLLKAAMCPVMKIPSFTFIIIVIDITLFALTAIVGLYRPGSFLEVSYDTLIKFRGSCPLLIYRGQVDRLVIAMFLHSNFMHLFGNLITTFVLVSRVEHTYGFLWTLLMYIVSGIAGNILAAVTAAYPYTEVNVGASTALYGMLGILIGYMILNWKGLDFVP